MMLFPTRERVIEPQLLGPRLLAVLGKLADMDLKSQPPTFGNGYLLPIRGLTAIFN